MPIRCIAVEDEPPALDKLITFISRLPQLVLVGHCSSSLDALALIQAERPELLFVDIQMESLTGLQMLDSLTYRPQVIFTTAYSQYALQGYDYCTADYLLKPYSFERFVQAVQKVRIPDEKADAQEFIFVKSDYRILRITLADIICIEGMRDYRSIDTGSGRVLTPASFAELEEQLPARTFQRVHKSYIVSLPRIDKVEHHRIYIGNKIIPIGDVYKDRFYQKLHACGK